MYIYLDLLKMLGQIKHILPNGGLMVIYPSTKEIITVNKSKYILYIYNDLHVIVYNLIA